MTREEAIKICTREKGCVQGALDACADGGHYVSPDGIITALDYVDALDMAIAALMEQESNADQHVSNASNALTNADHIRSMTDEELATWFDNGHCGSRSLAECQTYNGGCAACALDWLKQPYKEDT